MGFSRQEYWSGLPFPSPGDLPDQGIDLGLWHCRQIIYRLRHQGSPLGKLFWGAPKSLQMVTAAMKLRHLLLGRKAITNLDSILKSRDITLPTKVCLVKAMVFPVVMYGC